MAERWLPAVGFEEMYEVSDQGRVRNKKGHIMKQQLNKKYLKIGLFADGEKFYPTVHRLVAKAFIPNPEGKPQINHINSNPQDNRAVNLEWCTQAENIRHAFKVGNKTQKGEKNACAKLTDATVREIRQRAAEGELQYMLAEEFHISRANVCLIVNRKAWPHVK